MPDPWSAYARSKFPGRLWQVSAPENLFFAPAARSAADAQAVRPTHVAPTPWSKFPANSGTSVPAGTLFFDAPRHLVFDAMTRPELVKRWLFGPPGWSMVVCEDDVRVGGTFRWAWRGPDGAEMAMRGVYREVVPPERIVRTESFEFGCDAQAGEQLGTLVLTEQGGKTTLTVTVLYPSKEARDGAIASWRTTHTLSDPTAVQGWNGTFTQSGTALTVSSTPWNGALPPGGTASYGWVGSGAAPSVPTTVGCTTG